MWGGINATPENRSGGIVGGDGGWGGAHVSIS